RVALPEGQAPWTFEGFDVHTTPTRWGDAQFTFNNVRTHASADAQGTPLEVDYSSWSVWFSDSFHFGVGESALQSSPTSVSLLIGSDTRGASARFSPGGDGRGWHQPFAKAPTIPIAIDERLAAHLSVGVGDDVVLGARSYTIPGRIVATLPFVPGTDSPFGIITNLSSLNIEFLRSMNPLPAPGELWVTGDGSRPLADIARDLASLVGADATISTVHDSTQSAFPLPAERALWVSTAAS